MTETYGLPSPDTADVWERLAAVREPIFLYGTGNGADKILDEMERHQIHAAGVFASDGFVRERDFRGFRVRSYGDVCSEYDAFTVVLAFGTSRADVTDNIVRIASEHTLMCPDVPAFGDVIFDSTYYRAHFDEFNVLYARLADDESQRVLSCILEYKLTGSIKPLLDCGINDPAYGVIDFDAVRSYVDLGAYTGDTVREAVCKMRKLERVYAFEPEPRAYKKLRAYADTVDMPYIRTYNAAAWDASHTLTFTAASGRGSSADAGGHSKTREVTVNALALDDVDYIAHDNIDYIKFDVEGAEARALHGASATIERCHPAMCVSVYHRTEDLLELPALVDELCHGRRFYLRRERGLPAWGINLYVV